MKEIRFSIKFKKELQLVEKRGKNLEKFNKILTLLVHETDLPKKYKDHKLQGKFQGCRDCHIEPDWILIYRVLEGAIIFERTGTHSDLFKK